MLSRRDGTIFGLCRTKGISGLGSVVLNPYVPVLTGFSKKEGEMKFKKTRVGLFTDVTSLDYLITLPESKEIQDNLQLIDQMGNFGRVLDGSSEISTEEEGGSLMYRANLWRRFKYQHASELFDPDEIERLNALSSFYSSSSQTIRFVRDYVLHFSKLFLEGLFGDTQNSNVLICVKGPKEEDKVYIYDAMTNELRYNLGKCPPRECEEEFKHRLKNLEEFFAKETPWYENKAFTRPLDVFRMLDTYSKIGSSFSNQALTGISPTISSSCGAEPFISELYEAISGKECKRESLVDKLRVLNKREPFNGIFDEFIALYNQRGREGPGSVRGFASHVRGDTLTYSQNSLKETWASLYSLGLVKTATSVLLGDPTQFYEFDKFARKNGLIHSANLAYVPLANTHHNPLEFLPLISSE